MAGTDNLLMTNSEPPAATEGGVPLLKLISLSMPDEHSRAWLSEKKGRRPQLLGRSHDVAEAHSRSLGAIGHRECC
jgi:hypothetical protein